MAITAEDVIVQAKRRLSIGNSIDLSKHDIDFYAALPNALTRLGIKIMRDGDRRYLLQQDYLVTLDGSGIGDLITATGSVTSTADILTEGVYWGVVKDAEGNILQPLRNYSAFLQPQPTIFPYYCLVGRVIHTRALAAQVNSPSDVQGVAGPITVTSSYEPKSVSVVPDELEDDLIDCLIELVISKLPKSESYS